LKTASKDKGSKKSRRRRPKSVMKRNLHMWLRFLPFTAPIVITAFLYAWQHTRTHIVGLPIEDLRDKREELTKQNDSIRLRIEQLQAPARIESIARKKLGMISPEKWQVIALDQSERPPEPAVETDPRADKNFVASDKRVGLSGILKKRGSSVRSISDNADIETPQHSG